MPIDPKIPLTSRPNPLAAVAVRRRLEHGIAAIEVALQSLNLSVREKAALQAISASNQKLLLNLSNSPNAPRKVALKSLERKPEVRKAPARTKKEVAADRDRKLKMVAAKRKVEIETVHKKSGFSGFLRRVPGSFEGGKK